MAVFASISSPVSKFTRIGVLAAALWGGLTGIPTASARETTERGTSIALAELPPQGQQTYRTILQGGPFPHEKDGTVFGNRERLLPREPRGYYREYTVRTPGASNRGARRIVCGGQQPSRPDGCWYTADHYASFRKIVP